MVQDAPAKTLSVPSECPRLMSLQKVEKSVKLTRMIKVVLIHCIIHIPSCLLCSHKPRCIYLIIYIYKYIYIYIYQNICNHIVLITEFASAKRWRFALHHCIIAWPIQDFLVCELPCAHLVVPRNWRQQMVIQKSQAQPKIQDCIMCF